jgi:transposase-like protein
VLIGATPSVILISVGWRLLSRVFGVMGEQNTNAESLDENVAFLGVTAPEISPGSRRRNIPPPIKSIQVNWCKTPRCQNFGVPPNDYAISGGRGRVSPDGYKVRGFEPTDLLCHYCLKSSRIKSNLAIAEEYDRQSASLWAAPILSCPNPSCAHDKPKSDSGSTGFRRYGATRSGSVRWQCKLCKTTFAVGKPTRRHRKPHLNITAFELIVNKVSISRMSEILGVSCTSVYGKIDFLYRQCLAFSASRERELCTMAFDRLYLSTDRQDYIVNWGDRRNRKTVQLTTIGTADRRSGYVFGLTPNFDAAIDPTELERDWQASGDYLKAPAMRRFARLWTLDDYRASTEKATKAGGKEDIPARDDLDAPELLSDGQQLPRSGAQVHAEYVMHGHYWLLRSLFPKVDKLRFFIDRDAGLLHACMGAFGGRVKERTADIVVVDYLKRITVDERKKKQMEAQAWFESQRLRFPELTDKEARTAIFAEEIRATRKLYGNDISEVWINCKFPDIAEPGKRFKFITDLADYDDSHVANLLLLATLWPIDTVFNRIRRRIAAFERPVTSASRAWRLWHLYAPYDPAMVEKLLTIYRTWHNYIWVSPNTDKTAAEMLGLTKGRIRAQDIVYYCDESM